MTIDLAELRGYISNMYSDVACYPRGEFHFPTGRPLMERLGYDPGLLDRVPTSSLESFAGVGCHFSLGGLNPGDRVLDLGSGAGSDAYYAALIVGESGRVVGIDMTGPMLDRARKGLAAASGGSVDFVDGHIEELPFDAASFDVVISNGVINLTPRKPAVFAEIFRVLSPGGRLVVSDIVTGVELPQSVRENCELWAECIGGALEQQSYVKVVEDAGLAVEGVRVNEAYGFTQESTLAAAQRFQVRSISLLARRRS